MPSFKLKISWVTILQRVEFSIFLLIFAWALQQCSANTLPVMSKQLWNRRSSLLVIRQSYKLQSTKSATRQKSRKSDAIYDQYFAYLLRFVDRQSTCWVGRRGEATTYSCSIVVARRCFMSSLAVKPKRRHRHIINQLTCACTWLTCAYTCVFAD